MDKSPEAFRTISEVAEALSVPPHVLRFWESRFAQVKPVKRGGGRRYYRPEDVRLLRGIRSLLYDEGITIKGVQKVLRERGIRHVIGLGTLPDGELAAAAEHDAAPATTATPSAPKQPAARGVNGRAKPMAPEPDLFAPAAWPQPDAAVLSSKTIATSPSQAKRADGAAAGSVPGTLDREALRVILAELEDLRTRMIEAPRT